MAYIICNQISFEKQKLLAVGRTGKTSAPGFYINQPIRFILKMHSWISYLKLRHHKELVDLLVYIYMATGFQGLELETP